jgi:hypothetical protein
VIAVGAALALVASRVRLASLQRSGVVLIALAVAAPAATLRAAVPVQADLVPGATLWRAGGSVLEIDGRVDAGALLESLRRAGVGDLDVVLARTGSASARDVISVLRRRYEHVRVLLPSNTPAAVSIMVGQLRVDARPEAARLVVAISLEPAGRARGPPV